MLNTIEVIYSDAPNQYQRYTVLWYVGLTVNDAINATSLLYDYPNLKVNESTVGIFSKCCRLNDLLIGGERIEIYRSLIQDPKTRRRIKASH